MFAALGDVQTGYKPQYLTQLEVDVLLFSPSLSHTLSLKQITMMKETPSLILLSLLLTSSPSRLPCARRRADLNDLFMSASAAITGALNENPIPVQFGVFSREMFRGASIPANFDQHARASARVRECCFKLTWLFLTSSI